MKYQIVRTDKAPDVILPVSGITQSSLPSVGTEFSYDRVHTDLKKAISLKNKYERRHLHLLEVCGPAEDIEAITDLWLAASNEVTRLWANLGRSPTEQVV